MEARSLRFAAAARALGETARGAGFVAPAFRSPPRVKGRMRTIRWHASGSATVSLVLQNRPWSAVLADMIDGFVAVNAATHDDTADGARASGAAGEASGAERLRDLLWAAVEDIDLTDGSSHGAHEARSAPPLQVVHDAA